MTCICICIALCLCSREDSGFCRDTRSNSLSNAFIFYTMLPFIKILSGLGLVFGLRLGVTVRVKVRVMVSLLHA